MLKKMENQKKLSDNSLTIEKKKARKRVVIRSLLLIALLLVVNTFAWFTYISRAGVTLNGSVIDWDISFLNENGAVKDIQIDITDMKPGMIPFEYKIQIQNNSDVAANIKYDIKSVKLLGTELLQEGQEDQIEESLKTEYPFVLELITEKDDIGINEMINFKITLNWDYQASNYYKLNNLYTYDAGVYYYTIVDDTYQVDNTVTEETFKEKVASGLYLEKDDADSFFGYACGKYEEETKSPCLQMKLDLNVTQAN